MKISQLWTIDTIYAAWVDNPPLSPEDECSVKYPDDFLEFKNNQCFCKDEWNSILCSTLMKQRSPGEVCQQKYGDLFVAQNATKECLCTSPNKTDPVICSSLPQDVLNQELCGPEKPLRDKKTETCSCLHGLTTDGTACLANNYGDIGLKCSAQDILNNTCTWNINKTLGIKASNPIPNPELFVQDIVLGATSFVGTGIFIALVVMWFKAVAQGWSGSEDQMGKIKSWIINLLIGVALIMLSYTIIRIVQYVARGY